jgi:hypothetical protein
MHSNATASWAVTLFLHESAPLSFAQTEPQTDCHTTEVFYPGSGTGAECKKANNEKQGRGSRYVEGEDLNNQGRPNIRAEHNGQCRNQPNQL